MLHLFFFATQAAPANSAAPSNQRSVACPPTCAGARAHTNLDALLSPPHATRKPPKAHAPLILTLMLNKACAKAAPTKPGRPPASGGRPAPPQRASGSALRLCSPLPQRLGHIQHERISSQPVRISLAELSAVRPANTMIRTVLSDGEDRGSGLRTSVYVYMSLSTAQVASDSGSFTYLEQRVEQSSPRR